MGDVAVAVMRVVFAVDDAAAAVIPTQRPHVGNHVVDQREPTLLTALRRNLRRPRPAAAVDSCRRRRSCFRRSTAGRVADRLRRQPAVRGVAGECRVAADAAADPEVGRRRWAGVEVGGGRRLGGSHDDAVVARQGPLRRRDG